MNPKIVALIITGSGLTGVLLGFAFPPVNLETKPSDRVLDCVEKRDSEFQVCHDQIMKGHHNAREN